VILLTHCIHPIKMDLSLADEVLRLSQSKQQQQRQPHLQQQQQQYQPQESGQRTAAQYTHSQQAQYTHTQQQRPQQHNHQQQYQPQQQQQQQQQQHAQYLQHPQQQQLLQSAGRESGRLVLPPPEQQQSRHPVARAQGAAAAATKRNSGSSSSSAAANGAASSGSSSREQELERKEKAVRDALKLKQQSLREQSKQLAAVDQQLAQLSLEHQQEINLLRKRLEGCDKALVYLDRDAKAKKSAYETAQFLLDARLDEKREITSKLTTLILETEKRRDSKLNELLSNLEEQSSSSVPTAKPASLR
jgi:Transcriptional activator